MFRFIIFLIFLFSYLDKISSQCFENAINSAFNFECISGNPYGARLGFDSVVYLVPNTSSFFEVDVTSELQLFKNGVPVLTGELFNPNDEIKIKPILIGGANISWLTNTSGCGVAPGFSFQICLAPLPIIWHSPIKATLQNKNINITWSIATQLNNEKYIIEDSKDGRTFSPIGEIAGDGTTNETKHYEYIHTSPSNGINYYRIKQVDYDGKYSYSDIASVRYDGIGATSIYPNPATSEVTITTTSSTSLQIIDVYGRLLKRQDISEGQNTLNLSSFPSGILIFEVGDQRYKVLKE